MANERDVSPNSGDNSDNSDDSSKTQKKVFLGSIDRFEEKLIKKTIEVSKVLLDYLKNPIEGIKFIPDWGYRTLLFVLLSVAMISGLTTGLIGLSFLKILNGLIVLPVMACLMITVGTIFFYYSFQIFFNSTVPIKKLVTLLIFANIPFFIFQIVSDFIPPITLIGLAFTSFLLIVGFVEHFSFAKVKVMRLVGAVYVVIALYGIYHTVKNMGN